MTHVRSLAAPSRPARLRVPAGRLATFAFVLGWFVWLRPVALGGPATYVLVRGDSMEPTYHGGDLVVLERAPTYVAGEVVAYRVPQGELGAGRLVIHRIVAIDGRGVLELQGDNNPSMDPWQPTRADVAGHAAFAIPAVGSVLALLARPAVAAALAVSLLVALGIDRKSVV